MQNVISLKTHDAPMQFFTALRDRPLIRTFFSICVTCKCRLKPPTHPFICRTARIEYILVFLFEHYHYDCMYLCVESFNKSN